MPAFAADVRHALRMFRKAPLWTLSVAGTLALGIGAATAMFGLGNAVLFRRLPFPDPDRLVVLWTRDPHKAIEQERVTLADFADWRARSRSFEEIGYSFLWPGSRSTIVRGSSSYSVRSAMVSSAWLRALALRPTLGRLFTPDEDHRGASLAAMISDGFWERNFGRDRAVIGRSLVIDSYRLRNYRIVGVLPPGVGFPVDTEVYLSLGAAEFEPPPPAAGRRCCAWLEVAARLRPGLTAGEAEAELNRIQGSILAEHGPADVNPGVAVVPLTRYLTAGVRRGILILMAAVAFVLLIACANAANLMLARSELRRREMALRSALGATRSRIVRQLLTESILLSAAAGAAGLAMGVAALKVVVALAPDIPRGQEVLPDTTFVLICAATTLLTGVGFGLAPAWNWSSDRFVHGQTPIGGSKVRLRDGLIVGEVALSMVLLVGAALLLRSLQRLDAVDPGFRPESLVAASIEMTSADYSTSSVPGPNRPQDSFRRILERVRTLPGVTGAGGTNRLPLAGVVDGQGEIVAVEDRPGDRSLRGEIRAVTPDYFPVMGMRLVRGRGFTEADTDQSDPVVIVDESAARRYWPGEDPAGRRMRVINPRMPSWSSPWMKVVGVVADVRHARLDTQSPPQFYLPYLRGEWRNVFLVVRVQGEPGGIVASLRHAIAQADRSAAVTAVRPMTALVEASTSTQRFRTRLLALFSLLALLLAAGGIYAVMSYLVQQRTPEIGVRMALGAREADIFRMMLLRGSHLAGTGLMLGAGGSFALRRLLASVLFETSPGDPIALSAAAVVLLAVALAACWLPSRRAALLDPLTALRRGDSPGM